MLLKSILSIGALAVSANAFLVPSKFGDSQPHIPIRQGAQKVAIDCASCPYALKDEQDGQRQWKNDVPSTLEMEFAIKDNALEFNGVQIFPVNQPNLPPTLTVSQKAKEDVEVHEEGDVEDLRVSYSLEMIQRPFEDGNVLLTMTMSIMALENEMIRVDDIEVRVVKDAEGNLVHYDATPVPTSADSPDAKCVNVLCRVFTKFLTSVAKAKASAKTAAHKVKSHCMKCFRCILHMMGRKGHPHHRHGANAAVHGSGANPHRGPDGTVELPTHNKFRPHGHHGHHHRGFLGRMSHIFWVTFKLAFVPILIGVAFGMAASAIGMLFGQLLVFLWMRYRRSDATPAYERLPADEKAEVPPPYEDVPTIHVHFSDEKEIEDAA